MVAVPRLAEQGLATKRELLVVIPLTIYILVILIIYCRKGKGDKMKKMRKPGGKALKATLLETIKETSENGRKCPASLSTPIIFSTINFKNPYNFEFERRR
ncbi:MAG: hypothetical protein K0R15_326 [Clostridiales bacterium]|jgi:hypothetical protein|nr:hypothetical protein [Clostridiales bacterium]